MSTSKATARPWATERDGGVSIITDRDGNTVCVMMSEANAALIVRAVNSHEALVAALRGIIQAWDTDSGDYYVTNTLTDDDIDQARAALALAEQG